MRKLCLLAGAEWDSGLAASLASRMHWNMRSKITFEGLWSTRGDKDVPSAVLAGICGCSENQECDLPLAHPITSGQTVNGELDTADYLKYLLVLEKNECPEKIQRIWK